MDNMINRTRQNVMNNMINRTRQNVIDGMINREPSRTSWIV